jgi:hypothetical protein
VYKLYIIKKKKIENQHKMGNQWSAHKVHETTTQKSPLRLLTLRQMMGNDGRETLLTCIENGAAI